jgi:hypothetical protein
MPSHELRQILGHQGCPIRRTIAKFPTEQHPCVPPVQPTRTCRQACGLRQVIVVPPDPSRALRRRRGAGRLAREYPQTPQELHEAPGSEGGR